MKKVDFCFTWRHTWPQRRSLMIICLSPKMNCRVEVASFCSSLPRVGTRTKKMIKTAEITVSCGYVFNVGIVEHQLETQHVGKDFRVRSSVCSIQLDYKWSIKSAKFRLVTILLCVCCVRRFSWWRTKYALNLETVCSFSIIIISWQAFVRVR